MENNLQVNELTKNFGQRKILQGLTFSIQAGQILGFLGPNGAGKTTTFRILAGLINGTTGTVRLGQLSPTRQASEWRKNVALIGETHALPNNISVTDYLLFRAKIKGLANCRRLVDEMLHRCNLHQRARHRLIGQLSRGYRQRVAIADALLGQPRLLLLDEPTTGLDPLQLAEIRQLILALRGRTTVLFSSHILSEIEATCDQILILHGGKIIADGTRQTLAKQLHLQPLLVIKILQEENRALPEKWAEKVLRETRQNRLTELVFPLDERPQEQLKFIGSILESKDFTVVELAREEPSLETIFLAATENHWQKKIP